MFTLGERCGRVVLGRNVGRLAVDAGTGSEIHRRHSTRPFFNRRFRARNTNELERHHWP